MHEGCQRIIGTLHAVSRRIGENRDMNSKSEQMSGKLNSTLGRSKQAVGKASGNRKLQGKGILQRVKGKAQSLRVAVIKRKEKIMKAAS